MSVLTTDEHSIIEPFAHELSKEITDKIAVKLNELNRKDRANLSDTYPYLLKRIILLISKKLYMKYFYDDVINETKSLIKSDFIEKIKAEINEMLIKQTDDIFDKIEISELNRLTQVKNAFGKTVKGNNPKLLDEFSQEIWNALSKKSKKIRNIKKSFHIIQDATNEKNDIDCTK